MAEIKPPNIHKEPPGGETEPAASHAPPATSTSSSTSSTASAPAAPTPAQILQNAWVANVDAQTAQQFSGLTQIRQARANQLTRVVTNFTQTYGAKDPRTVAAQTSLTGEQTFSTRLGLVQSTTATPPPTAPANGWVIYGKVLNSDGSAALQLTVFLADSTRAWLQQYAYAFTDQTGYYTLT